MANIDELPPESHSENVTNRVLAAIAEETNADPTEFDLPLYEVIDPDALKAFIRHSRCPATVEFGYLGYRVSVAGNGEVAVTDANA